MLNLKLTNPFESVICLESRVNPKTTTKFRTSLRSNNAYQTYNYKPWRLFQFSESVVGSFDEKHNMNNDKISKLLTPISKESI